MLKHYQRTECGCAKCATCCEIMPGYLVPDDLLPYISATTGKSIWDIKDWSPEKFREWTGGHLLASDGYLVISGGIPVRAETLVPRGKSRGGTGACMNLSPSGGCAVHESSPWGCRMFSACKPHDQKDELDKERDKELSLQGFHALREEKESHNNGGFSLYYTMWEWLSDNGGKHPISAKARKGRLRRKLEKINH